MIPRVQLLVTVHISIAFLLASASQADESINFNRDVRPIFNEHCVACHGGVKQAGDLSFVHSEQASWIVEPGDPEASVLIERVTAEDEDRMPPPAHGPPLNAREIGILQSWIKQGAKWGKHWAFVAPNRYRPPNVADDPWCRARIDPFILDRMRREGLSPAQDSAPDRWLRRVSLDLCGIPPTPDERDRFVADVKESGEPAFRRAVDRLLNSPLYGERWASVWLDAVRYADSRGLGLDGRRTIWKYRDWVIQALNDDMPYDKFTIRQIAGDLLNQPTIDDLVATACNRLTQTNEEGGTDDEMFRVEAVVDRVNTLWQAWQGLSFGCVQCHSHPYDPITHDEYYRFLAFYNNTVDCDLGSEAPNLPVPVDQSNYKLASEIDREIKSLKTEAWKDASDLFQQASLWTALSDLSVATNNSTRVVVQTADGIEEYVTKGTVAKETTVTVEAPMAASTSQIAAFRFTGLPQDEATARIHSEWGFVLSHVTAELISQDGKVTDLPLATVIGDEPDPIADPQLSLNGKSRMGFGAYSRIHYPRSAVFVLESPVDVDPGDRIRISLAQNVFELGAFPLVAHRGRIAVTGSDDVSAWFPNPQRQSSQSRLSELKRQRASIPSIPTPILSERSVHLARPTHVFDRGNYLTKMEAVTSRTPSFLPAGNENSANPPSRLDLAKWLASEANPLTARVAVNRVWGALFGIGIVETQEDFGSSGEAPSHPRLLDDLSARFQSDLQWSTKALLRELVLSSTYRQSSRVTEEKLEVDPRNRLLSRGPRNRLPAEIIRDQSLAVAGLLSTKQFGPPVHPPIPDGVWKPFQASDRWATPDSGSESRYRRTVYTYTKRTIPFPMMAAFDAPSREFCAVRRLPSNTPLQALMTLNDSAFVEASQWLARRMIGAGAEKSQQLKFGFLLVTSREPRDAELNELIRLYDSEASTNDENHAMKSVASVLLNLDEVLSK